MEVIAIQPSENNNTRSYLCDNASNSFIYKYHDFFNTDLSFWMPKSDQQIKYIKVNFIIIQREYPNPPDNFTENGISNIDTSYTDEDFLRELIERVNITLGNLEDPSDIGGVNICGPCNQIKDTRIRLKLTDIRYFQSNLYYGSSWSIPESWQKKDEINLVISGNNSNLSYANLPSLYYHTYPHNAFINRLYQDYITYGPNTTFSVVHMLLHEIGHNFGLCHTYYGGGCPNSCEDMLSRGYYFDDIFDLYPSNNCPERNFVWNSDPWLAPDDYISNNIMSGTINRKYYSPKQIAVIHRNLSLYSIRNCVSDETHEQLYKLEVEENETWDFSFRVYQDILVKSNSILNIACEVILPINNGKIVVESGSALDLTGKLTLNDGNVLTVESGATLKLSDDSELIINGNGKIEVESGAYLCIEDGAYIELNDFESVINLRNGWINGANPALFTNPNCIASPQNYLTFGDGSINEFQDNVYIQNETINNNRYYSGNNIYIGYEVYPPPSMPPYVIWPLGNVLINNNSNVIIDAEGEAVLDKGFEIELGSTIEIK